MQVILSNLPSAPFPVDLGNTCDAFEAEELLSMHAPCTIGTMNSSVGIITSRRIPFRPTHLVK